MILKSEIYNFHRLDLTGQSGFIVTIYDGLRLAATAPVATPAEAFSEARKIIDNKVEGPRPPVPPVRRPRGSRAEFVVKNHNGQKLASGR